MRRIFLSITAVMCLVGTFEATEASRPLTFYRDSQGVISAQSRENAVIMRRIAGSDGHVSLWLTINYPFNFYFDQMTAEETAAQEREVQQGFAKILGPLVDRGVAWHPSSGPHIAGPGCTVQVTVAGLNRLLRDRRLLQITAIESVPLE